MSVDCDSLVEHVAHASVKTYLLLRDNSRFARSATFLGRDATPVQLGVAYLNKKRGRLLDISGFDISSKLLIENWHQYEPASQGKMFIERLNANLMTQEEMRSSMLYRYLKQEYFLPASGITLLDNGFNGTLLRRLSKMLHIAEPDLHINNIMLYYSGDVPVENLTVVLADARDGKTKSERTEHEKEIYYQNKAFISLRNGELESWPHPQASASNYYEHEGRIHVGHVPNECESVANYTKNIPINEKLLRRLERELDSMVEDYL